MIIDLIKHDIKLQWLMIRLYGDYSPSLDIDIKNALQSYDQIVW